MLPLVIMAQVKRKCRLGLKETEIPFYVCNFVLELLEVTYTELRYDLKRSVVFLLTGNCGSEKDLDVINSRRAIIDIA